MCIKLISKITIRGKSFMLENLFFSTIGDPRHFFGSILASSEL